MMGGWLEPDRELRLQRGSQGLDSILVYLVAWAAITKYHRLGGLHTRTAFSHSSGGWKSEINMLAGSLSFEVSPLGLQMAVFSLYLYMVFPLGLAVS